MGVIVIAIAIAIQGRHCIRTNTLKEERAVDRIMLEIWYAVGPCDANPKQQLPCWKLVGSCTLRQFDKNPLDKRLGSRNPYKD